MAAKISIIGQIAEIDREIALREQGYPRQVSDGKMKKEAAQMLMDRIHAVRATLMFCKENEADIRTFMECRREFREFLAQRRGTAQ